MKASSPSPFRYLVAVGAVNTWFLFVFLAFAAWIVYLRSTGEKPELAQYLFLILVPFAAGTGLISAGRRGELDLLLGTGASRSRLWRVAFAYAWLIPALMAAVITAVSVPRAGVLFRLPVVLLFVSGISFASGLVEIRYFAAAVWLLLRFMVLLWPDTMLVVKQWETGAGIQSRWLKVVVAAALPELMLDAHTPSAYLIAATLVGLAAIAGSYLWFCSTEFAGKRS